ncbi:MAG: hypothetical protein GY788_27920 [bacterium]|nr:hypothetical protein [bacterium]
MAFQLDDEPLDVKFGHKTIELFVYLALNNDFTHRRERLAELLWPGKPARQSRSALNTTVWRINAASKRSGIDSIASLSVATDAAIRLTVSKDVRIDCIALPAVVTESEAHVRERGDVQTDLWERLQKALEGYRGPFMDGHDSDWILRERERFYSFYIRGMVLTVRVLARNGRYEEALECARGILKWDDLRETVQRETMWLYVMNGQRCEAIAQYERFRGRLLDEIGVEPMAETTSLYYYILAEAQRPAIDAAVTVSASDLMAFMAQCDVTRSSVFAALSQSNPEE